jgi:hypothetical protein
MVTMARKSTSKKFNPAIVDCSSCLKPYEAEFDVCPHCGTENPRREQTEQLVMPIHLERAVHRALVAIALKRGVMTLDVIVTEALEEWISRQRF